ncbi:hypothetical protein FRC14_002378 [Serendipita sp. 396]|nr:hypothetical protein FRC14_002378 [Serendipita sp. 396]KAG8785125.1 hypothetical protein FRC15_001942 [Serendipita sp. 397]KAG8800839.1 hypothetical protein FRC16_001947 [Serendipita sp. 398]
MAVHIASARSIGYYDKQTLKFVGDWSWTVIRSVYLCVSGQLTDGTYQSWCSSTSSNNDFGYGGCVVAIGQPYVADGCYTPDTSAAAVQVASSIGGGSPSPSSSGSGSGSGSGSSTGGDGSQGGPFTPSRGSHRSVLPTALALLFSVLTSVTIMI